MCEDGINDFIKRLDFSGKYNTRQIFEDVVSIGVYTINALQLGNEKYNELLNQIIKKYTKQEQKQMFELVIFLAKIYIKQKSKISDILGKVYNKLMIGNATLGQFFTPSHIAHMMAQTVGIEEEEIKQNGYINLVEPCVGAGVMCLSYAKVMQEKGYNPSEQLCIVAKDIDRFCCYMSYLQFALYDIPAVVINGNSLTDENNFVLYTPQYFIFKHKQGKEQ